MTKVCKQCGESKPQDQYRKYYGGRSGTYNTCKACEKINSREKYLSSKSDPSPKDLDELQKIYKLWDYQKTLGLKPPRKLVTPIVDIDLMLAHTAAKVDSVKSVLDPGTSVPPDLIRWLTEELTEPPEYYQEQVYDKLQEKYRKRLSFDPRTLLPIYDSTYFKILDAIAQRFDEYEDTYYNNKEN